MYIRPLHSACYVLENASSAFFLQKKLFLTYNFILLKTLVLESLPKIVQICRWMRVNKGT